MGLVGELRDAEGITPVDIADLEEDLRQGRLSGAFLLRYAPWTGEEFKRLRDIPELKEALDSKQNHDLVLFELPLHATDEEVRELVESMVELADPPRGTVFHGPLRRAAAEVAAAHAET